MSNTQRPYTGVDKLGTATHAAAKQLSEYLGKRYGMTYLGGLAVRAMRSAPAAIQKLPPNDPRVRPYLSTHATGRAIDMGLNDAAKLGKIFELLVNNADELFLESVHQYSYRAPGSKKAWGRGYRCNRARKDRGIVEWDAKNNGGTAGGLFLHIEISPTATAPKMLAAFRAIQAK